LEYVLTFRNTHDAIYSEKLLAKKISVRVMALPTRIDAGCGICLRVDPDYLEQAQRLLAQQDVKPGGIYRAEILNGEAIYTKCSP
jgi:hypothetical protein